MELMELLVRSNTVHLVDGIECRIFEFGCVESVVVSLSNKFTTIWHTQMVIGSCFVCASYIRSRLEE